ncbi:hypothetical protein M430DRAFT_53620 [Amorphotheca resinae ATCC 22711]|uniref:Uncharacterized protein n=1 Tax=Amorphotheca resinae ATCC 22711 TaxID=857342 RepID=A0A2T3ARR6_AMORE|nr:hypothetical protein M430DRAFT_53620 [Amorphotheca resinae ATCC 22711]PSS09061.1 hypothetical protein M430DRAFT_53620 [Amorphotheca resinae ATCC 22711]
MPSAKDVAKEAKKAKDKKPAVSKMPAKKAPPPSKLSTEYVQDSDSDANSTSDDGSLPDNPAAAKAKASGKAKNAVADSSSSGSGSGSESESGSESSANESSSEEDEDEDEDGSSEEEEEETNSPVVSKPKQSSTQSSTKAVTLQEPAPYSPPTGFKSASVNGTTKSSQLFKESNLQGKQIWYITAPASAPLSSIEELSLLDIKEHRKVLSHKGDNYGFFEDESEATAITKVLVPSSSDDGYRSAKTPVNKILHLQQIVQPPSLPQITTPAKKPVRQQPRGLKMRFRPIGFSNGDMGRIGSSSSSEGESSDQEMQDAPAAKFRKPESLSATESSDGSEDDDSSSHAKKTKAPPKSSKSKAPAVESSKKTDGSLKRKSSEGGDKKSKHKKTDKKSKDHKQPISAN